jgi:PHD/YefM family antitoxin component YafN of YafNO toxin-antitoxin module
MAVLASEGDNVKDVVDRVLATRDRLVVDRAGVPAAVVMTARDLEGLEYTIDLLSEPRTVRRILEGEAALQGGNLYMGEELAALDPDARFVARAVTGGVVLAAAMRSGGGSRWDLVASVPARRALDDLQFHVADAVRRFIFGQMLNDPAGHGVELRGFLGRRLAARVETALVIYRLDSVKHVVRLVEVLHLGGLVGQHESRRW